LLLSAVLLAAAGCDNPAPRPDKKLPMPKGESALDDLLKKARAKPAPPLAPGRLEANPAAVEFVRLAVGEDVARQVQISNPGASPVTLGQLHVAGQSSMFRLGGSCAAGLVIEGGRGCRLEVTFHPVREGSADGEVVISHDAAGGSLLVSLSGQAKAGQSVASQTVNAEASLIFARSRQDAGLAVNDGAPSPRATRTMSDADYREAGLPGIVSTFPVDRSRVITADRYIPAVLENTLSSQQPGRAVAVVERNVYGAEGRAVLIPAGSRAIGQYRSQVKMGEARLEIGWSRIIRPDGVSINVDDQAADVMGRSGVPGDLDTRFFEKYGSSLLTSVVAAAGDWALGGNSTAIYGPLGGTTQAMSGRARATNRLGNDLDQLGQRMVQENVDIRPVLTVAQGTRLNIIPSEDIWLRDPDRLQAASPPKGNGKSILAKADNPTQLIPGLVEMLAQNPMLQKVAPQTAQQIMQAAVLQQLRTGNYSLFGQGDAPASQPAGGSPEASPARRP
jgi:type IV secretory pathway VirB10-like protein